MKDNTTFCNWCRGSGKEDSGGFTEYGQPIDVPCGACNGSGRIKSNPKADPLAQLPDLDWGDPVNHDNREIVESPVINPFTVIIDTREQAPWGFTGLRADSKKKYRPLVVFTEKQGLKSGDYSIKGFEDQFSIERKSLPDAFSTFTVDRERFERELERLNAMRFAAVVIEGGWEQIVEGPDRLDRSDTHRQVIGKTCYRSILAWSQRFPNVHFFPMPGRQFAEQTAFRIMQRFWEDREWEKKEARVRQMQLGLEVNV